MQANTTRSPVDWPRWRQHFREPDKRLHFWVSAHLVLAGLWLYPPELVIPSVFLVGLLKEGWDHFLGSGFCKIDIVANTLGILHVFTLFAIFCWIGGF